MKKLISFLLVIMLVVLSLPLSVSAAEADHKVKYTYQSTKVDSQNFMLNIYMDVESSEAKLWGFSFDLAYSKGLALESITYNDLLPGKMNTPIDSANAANKVAISFDSGFSMTDKSFKNGNYLVATLTFKCAEELSEKDVKFSFADGVVARVGQYENELIYEFVSANVIAGDVNGDGRVNGKDYALLLQSINGWDVAIDKTASDVNGDGRVNGKDYGLLLQFINGWDVKLTSKA